MIEIIGKLTNEKKNKNSAHKSKQWCNNYERQRLEDESVTSTKLFNVANVTMAEIREADMLSHSTWMVETWTIAINENVQLLPNWFGQWNSGSTQ